MVYYHGSEIGGLEILKPFVSEHEKFYVYFSANPVLALIYSVRLVSKPFSFYPYGFNNGVVEYIEYYPNAFHKVFSGKTGYLYECSNIENMENPTNINSVLTVQKEVAVDNVKQIINLEKQFLDYEKQGLFKIKKYEQITEKELNFINNYFLDLIDEHDLKSKPNLDMSRFIAENFPNVWEN
ncbi:MAG: hypothetical protein R3Y35_12960 [Clostridia bacterium]